MRLSTPRKVIDLRPNLDSIDADRMLIAQTAAYVGNLWKQMNSAEMYIAAGREFKSLHDHLSKNSRHDKARIGWVRAFSLEENKFGCERRQAETYVAIYRAFFHVGNALPTWRLPQSLRALFALSKLDLSADHLQKLSADGSLKPTSTEADVRRIAAKLAPPPKPASKRSISVLPSKRAPKQQRIQAALDVLAKLGLTVADLEKGA